MEERPQADAPLHGSDGFPRFSDEELGRRFALVRAMMDREGLAALLAYGTSAAHSEVHFLADFRVTREAMLTFPREGEPTLFVQFFNHVPNARRVSFVKDVRWGGPDTAATVAEDLKRRGLAGQRIGLAGPLPWQRYETLRRALPAATLVDATAALQQLRLVKSAEELAFLRRGAALSDRAVEALEREARPGLTEYALAAIVEGAYLGLGGQTHIHYMGTTPRVAAVVRSGATVEAVLDAAEGIHAAGYTICDDLAHGFGGGYLPPVVRTRQTGGTSSPGFTFAEDMTIVIQPNVVTRDEQMGLQVGELVRVTREGVESLHRYPMRFIRCG